MNNEFINRENIELIWEIIIDNIPIQNGEEKNQIMGYFINQSKLFYEKEKNIQQELISMNKKFITQIINAIKPTQQQQPPHPQQQQPITSQDIKNGRLSSFAQTLAQKKEEFEESIKNIIPESPNFKDNNENDKLIGKEMNDLIAATLLQRNLDMDLIQNTNNKDATTWLNLSKTNKPENKETNNKEQTYYQTQTPKLIHIGDEVSNEILLKKNISWGQNEEFEDTNFSSNSILTKLKYIKEPEPESESKNIKEQVKEAIENIIQEKNLDIWTEIRKIHDKLDILINKNN